MNQSKTKITTRKFYNKWLYKISIDLDGVALFREVPLDNIKSYCLGNRPLHLFQSYINQTKLNKGRVYMLADILSNEKDEWAKRIEQRCIDIYTNNVNLYNQLSEEFKEELYHRFEPAAGSADILNDTSVVAVKKLPHNRYKFKVYLWPHKMKDQDDKVKFVNWVETHSPKILMSEATKQWFIKTRYNWDRRYILIEDEHTLLMTKLKGSEIVGRIYNHVLIDK